MEKETENQGKETKEDKKKKESAKKKQNHQLVIAITLMILMILIIVLVPFIKDNYINKFTYSHLEFQKIKNENLLIYSTQIPVVDSQNRILPYSWNFRNDPRQLKLIPVRVPNKSIAFLKNKPTYISIEKDAPFCPDNTLAVFSLLNFLDDFGNLDVKGAVSDSEYSEETSHPFITCENSPLNTVIIFKSGNETSIENPKENCYEINYKECEVNQATEKFMFVILEEYMDVFNKKMRTITPSEVNNGILSLADNNKYNQDSAEAI